MIRPNSLRILGIIVAIVTLTIVSFAAQRRTTKKKPTTPSPPPPPTLQSCGLSLRLPPGWELTLASEYKKKHPEPDSQPDTSEETPEADPARQEPTTPPSAATESPSSAAPQPSIPRPQPPSDNPCSFVIAQKYPSEIIRNTDPEDRVGTIELQAVAADLDTAAPQLFEKDEKGWYATGPKGTRYDARLTKQKKGLQILSAVIVQACHDLNGKYRGLCEVNLYVYSNGRRSAIISAGPYLGETESTILNSLRFTPVAKPLSRKKR